MLSVNARPNQRARWLPRRSAWVLACLWLLMVLVPLRAWASAEMMVAMAAPHAPASAEHTDSQPPCHALADAAHDEPSGTDADSPSAACGCCPFCASALASVSEPPQGPILAPDAARTALAVAPSSGDPEPFFRPPRG